MLTLTLAALAQAQSPAQPKPAQPKQDPAIERRIDALLAKMTVEEKLGQMSQSSGVHTPLSDADRQEIRAGRWGSYLNAGSPAERAEIQRLALHESRLGIPVIFGRDVIHGYRTVFPIPLGQAASWDAELIRAAARVAGREAASTGIHWTFAPMLDITRDPRWGRVAETLGEDPFVTAALGAAMVRGFQGDRLDAVDSIAACAKHYVGYGAAEGGRDYNSTYIPEIQLRQVFLPSFAAAREAGAVTFMSSFNSINGVPASGNEFTLKQVLRNEWGFDGFVVSDWNSITEMIAHGYAADAQDAAKKGIRAGVDMEMVSTSYYDHAKDLLAAGQIDMRTIDEEVRNILRVKLRLGLFDRAVPAAYAEIQAPDADALTVAKNIATESAVLLKNDGALPLSRNLAKLAVVGPLADAPVDQLGCWVADFNAKETVTPLAALRAKLGADRVVYARALKNSRDASHDGFAAALAAARQADVVVAFLGEEAILSGEAHARAYLNLPGAQEALVEELAKTGKPLVVVIAAGRPLTFHDVAVQAAAVLYSWHNGTMGGPAVADLLMGDATPSGKLTITFPRTVGQVPIYYAHLSTGRPPQASELGIPAGTPVDPKGFTSKYLDVDFTPEYPFGYGLSYTKFDYSAPRVEADGAGGFTVSAEVTNAGARDGDEIVQLYIHAPGGTVARPVRELKGFQRIHLKAGEKQAVRFTLGQTGLAAYGTDMKLAVTPGRYQVWIAPDSARGAAAEFAVK
jgi:beta-glucosidase